MDQRWLAIGGLVVGVLGLGVAIGTVLSSGGSSNEPQEQVVATASTRPSPRGSASGSPRPTLASDAVAAVASALPTQASTNDVTRVAPQIIIVTPVPNIEAQPVAPDPAPIVTNAPVTNAPVAPKPTSAPTPVPAPTQPPTPVPAPTASAILCTGLYFQYYLPYSFNPISSEQFKQLCDFMGIPCLEIYLRDYLPYTLNPLPPDQFKQQFC